MSYHTAELYAPRVVLFCFLFAVLWYVQLLDGYFFATTWYIRLTFLFCYVLVYAYTREMCSVTSSSVIDFDMHVQAFMRVSYKWVFAARASQRFPTQFPQPRRKPRKYVPPRKGFDKFRL